ncbi:hypothetical protein SLE2022_139970 [Rubroshorea leprosula]
MEILSAAGGAFLTVVFERLFNKLDSSKALNLQEQVLIKLRQWKSLSSKIRALLEDAERTQMFNPNDSVKIWLDEIRDLAYDMEDVLDEFVTDARRSNLTAKPHRASTSKLIPSCFNCFKQSDFVSNSQAISKVDDITCKLQDMIDESKTLNLLSSTTQARDGLNKASTRRLPTTALPEPYVYGRESDKAAILQKLLNDEGSNSKGFCVVPIYGMGGVGKTTLAQLVYNEVKPESFEPKAWVCVSDQIDIPSITRTVLEAVGGKCDSNDLNLLQQELNNQLSNKKFLLVLDDIWNEDYSLWDSLQKPFLSGAAGSKIMITTRSEHVVEIMRGKSRAHHLEVLKDEECLSIFAQHALGANNFDAYLGLKEVGEKIVKKCKGLPLAAKVLGGLLCDKLDHSAWEHILNSEIWQLQESERGILPALRLSYYYLPSCLKPCFAYCSVFPKDYAFDQNELVLLWMAMGLLQQQDSEVDGHRYFNELVSRAFFQRLSGGESQYVMHDLIHDLAQFVAGKTSFNLENLWEANKKSKVNFEKVRHLSFNAGRYDISKKFEVLKQMKSLRTFIPSVSIIWPDQSLSNTVVHDWLPKLQCLRALSLSYYRILKLPNSIGDLKCLSLPLLRELDIENCNAALLKSMVDLTSVTRLGIERISELNCMPKSFVESLTMLESLIVGSCEELTCLWEEGTEIANLARLERMEIRDCPLLVCLAGKEQGLLPFNLKNLHLQNCGELESLPNVLMMKMDGGSNNILFTPENLTFSHCSSLKSFPGGKLPTTIRSLCISNCENLESLLDVDNNNLKHLRLSALSSLNSFQGGQLPDSLESFVVENCKGLESFPERMLQRCARLQDMFIIRCVKLKSLPIFNGNTIYQLQSLRSLYIRHCPSIKCITNGALPANLTSLVLDCENLMLLPNNVVELRSLQTLSISDGCLLVGLDLRNLSSLQELAISQTWPPDIVLPSSLTYLEIIDVENLKSISKEMLHSLNSLQGLHLSDCPNLRTLPREDLPPLLGYLSIINCQHLKRQHFEAKGDYLHLTRSIPCIEIDEDQVKPYL